MKSVQRQLFIMRHAKSSWGAGVSNDFERPLNNRGITDAPKVGQWLKQAGCVPDAVISSPAVRARQTARAVCEQLPFKIDDISWQQQLYNAGLGDVLKVLAAVSNDVHCVLLIAHNPGLEYLLQYLAGETLETTEDGRLLPTATCAALNLDKSWAELENDDGQLISLIRPKTL